MAKVACRVVSDHCASLLKPQQLGVGVKGGAEALVHGACRYVDNLSPSHVLVKLDFKNAFNSVRRDLAVSRAEAAWKALGGVVCPVGRDAGVQRG